VILQWSVLLWTHLSALTGVPTHGCLSSVIAQMTLRGHFCSHPCIFSTSWFSALCPLCSLLILMYMYIHTNVFTHTHTHTHTHTRMHAHTGTCTHIHIYIHTYTCTHIHTHIFTHTHTHVQGLLPAHICKLHVCTAQQKPEEGVLSSGTGVTGGCELPHVCCDSNSGPLEEQPVLLITEPSLQSQLKES
jgi:hypothetical protein